MKTIASVLTILFFSVYGMSPAQNRLIHGVVSDESGTPLAGVHVIVKGTSGKTVTDLQGAYRITVGPKDKILLFAFPGMEQTEVRIGSSSQIDVTMKTSQHPREEVIFREYEARDRAHKTMEDISAPAPGRVKGTLSGGHTRHHSQALAYEGTFQQWNTEGYSAIHENGFKDVLHQPLSTFSIDVDRASYSNVRRFLNMGQLPPVDAVRIEEMINYFSYEYPEPKGEHPFSVYTEFSECPWNEDHQLLHVGLRGKSIEKDQLPPSNLVFLIDVSGSMGSPNKLPLLKQAFRMLARWVRAIRSLHSMS